MDGRKIPIQILLKDFRRWLVQEEYNQKIEISKMSKNLRGTRKISNNYKWIENLLQTPIDDHRKYSVFHIMVPYHVNTKALSKEEVSRVIVHWLSKCNRVKPLDFGPHKKSETG